MKSQTKQTVAIAGGGLAGLAAGCALADAGYRVQLFERRPYLGGRASSYQHPGTGEVVDNCQHVLLGCCTNLLDLYRRSGVLDQVRWFKDLIFMEPGGRRLDHWAVVSAGTVPYLVVVSDCQRAFICGQSCGCAGDALAAARYP